MAEFFFLLNFQSLQEHWTTLTEKVILNCTRPHSSISHSLLSQQCILSQDSLSILKLKVEKIKEHVNCHDNHDLPSWLSWQLTCSFIFSTFLQSHQVSTKAPFLSLSPADFFCLCLSWYTAHEFLRKNAVYHSWGLWWICITTEVYLHACHPSTFRWVSCTIWTYIHTHINAVHESSKWYAWKLSLIHLKSPEW